MISTATPPENRPPQGPDPGPALSGFGELPARSMAEWRLRALERLAETGLAIADDLQTQSAVATRAVTEPSAERAPNLPSPPELALAHARISRGVRMTIALHAKLSGDYKTQAKEAYGRALWERGDKLSRVRRILAKVASSESDDTEKVERFTERLSERLDDEDDLGHLLDLPIAEIIARICKDFGLKPDWTRWQQQAWAQADSYPGKAAPTAGDAAPQAGSGTRPPGPVRSDRAPAGPRQNSAEPRSAQGP